MLQRSCSLFIALVVGVLVSGQVRADEKGEKKVAPRDLPKAVADAVKAKYPDAEMVGASTEKEDGKTVYEVAIKNKDQKIELTFTEDGTLTEIEKELKADDLPKAVAETLSEKYPGATYQKIEEIVKVKDGGERTEGYEVLLTTSEKKRFEVVVSPEGKVTKQESKTKKEDK